MPYSCFTKLYNALVVPIIQYGAAIWGTKSFSGIDAIHNRACRFFLGVGKYTPNAAVQGDMGWPLPIYHQWSAIIRFWKRLEGMNVNRIDSRVFSFCKTSGDVRHKNWCFRVTAFFNKNGLPNLIDPIFITNTCTRILSKIVQDKVRDICKDEWSKSINRIEAKNGKGNNKHTINFKKNFKLNRMLQMS